MNRKLITLLVPALLVLAPLVAGAGDRFTFPEFDFPSDPMPPMPPHHGMFVAGGFPDETLSADPGQMVRLAQRLALTPEQRQAYGRIMDEAAPKMRDLLFRMQDTRGELEAALDADDKDETALRKLADTQGRLHADLLYLQLATRAKLRALLDDAQRAKLEDGEFGRHGPFARLRGLQLPRRDRSDGAD